MISSYLSTNLLVDIIGLAASDVHVLSGLLNATRLLKSLHELAVNVLAQHLHKHGQRFSTYHADHCFIAERCNCIAMSVYYHDYVVCRLSVMRVHCDKTTEDGIHAVL